MEMSFGERLKHAWDVFRNKDEPVFTDYGNGSGIRPDRPKMSRGTERTIVNSIFNRISMDVASLNIYHVRMDENGRYTETICSGLNECLTLQANIDQTGRAFIHDLVFSMFDEGVIAIVPTETTLNPEKTGSYDINSMRVCKIIEWYPKHIKVSIYNENTGLHVEKVLPKSMVAIVENPFYAVVNEQNSTLKRLIRKLSLLDVVDEQSSSGKLDLIIQLPYVIKTEARRQQAEERRQDIEKQLSGSKYGIAYTDGTEHITQLNRAVENNLLKQVEYLTSMLYSQLGITQSVLDGSADDKIMQGYYARTIEPIVAAIVDEMKRKFLTKTARTQRQSIMFFRDPFKLVPVTELAEISDKMTRNEIMSSNDIRQIIGMKPSDDPEADELRNKNLNKSKEEMNAGNPSIPSINETGSEIQNGVSDSNQRDQIVDDLLNSIESQIDSIIANAENGDEDAG